MSLDQVFEALSSTVRRKILAYLSATDLTAGEIAERFSKAFPIAIARANAVTCHARSSLGV